MTIGTTLSLEPLFNQDHIFLMVNQQLLNVNMSVRLCMDLHQM